jgi:hypothetical protein
MKRSVAKTLERILGRFEFRLVRRSELEQYTKSAIDVVNVATSLMASLDVIAGMESMVPADGAVKVARWATARSRETLRQRGERLRRPPWM